MEMDLKYGHGARGGAELALRALQRADVAGSRILAVYGARTPFENFMLRYDAVGLGIALGLAIGLRNALRDRSAERGMERLSQPGVTSKELLKLMTSKDGKVRRAAMTDMRAIDSPDSIVRKRAAQYREQSTEHLIRLMSDFDPEVRDSALRTFLRYKHDTLNYATCVELLRNLTIPEEARRLAAEKMAQIVAVAQEARRQA